MDLKKERGMSVVSGLFSKYVVYSPPFLGENKSFEMTIKAFDGHQKVVYSEMRSKFEVQLRKEFLQLGYDYKKALNVILGENKEDKNEKTNLQLSHSVDLYLLRYNEFQLSVFGMIKDKNILKFSDDNLELEHKENQAEFWDYVPSEVKCQIADKVFDISFISKDDKENL